MIFLWCGGMRRGSCLMGSCSPVLISCFIRSHYPKSQLLIADMPSYWSIGRENCLFCSSEGPSELDWITFALLFPFIFLSITEQYGWLGADGLLPISVGVALPLTPLTVWYSATGRSDRKVKTLTEKLARPKTAFLTPRGQFQWRVMPFGLTNGLASLTRLMNLAVSELTSTLSCVFGWYYYLGPFLRGTSSSPTVIIWQETNCCS